VDLDQDVRLVGSVPHPVRRPRGDAQEVSGADHVDLIIDIERDLAAAGAVVELLRFMSVRDRLIAGSPMTDEEIRLLAVDERHFNV
jgi:hypothetical protein